MKLTTLKRTWQRWRAKPTCVVCGRTDSTGNPVRLGYTIPPSRGGADTPDYLRPICRVHYDADGFTGLAWA